MGARLLRFGLASLLIGFILGPMVEEDCKRAMLIYRGVFTRIMERPISSTLPGNTALLLLWTAWMIWRSRRRRLATGFGGAGD